MYWEWINGTITAMAAAVIGAFGFLIRQISTNQKEISILKEQTKNSENMLTEMRSDIKKLIARVGQ